MYILKCKTYIVKCHIIFHKQWQDSSRIRSLCISVTLSNMLLKTWPTYWSNNDSVTRSSTLCIVSFSRTFATNRAYTTSWILARADLLWVDNWHSERRTCLITVTCNKLLTVIILLSHVWACVAKRRHWLGEEMYGIWGGGLQTKR